MLFLLARSSDAAHRLVPRSGGQNNWMPLTGFRVVWEIILVYIFGSIIPVVENPMEEKMENEMETLYPLKGCASILEGQGA